MAQLEDTERKVQRPKALVVCGAVQGWTGHRSACADFPEVPTCSLAPASQVPGALRVAPFGGSAGYLDSRLRVLLRCWPVFPLFASLSPL